VAPHSLHLGLQDLVASVDCGGLFLTVVWADQHAAQASATSRRHRHEIVLVGIEDYYPESECKPRPL
jgi:hypothetical protein